MGRIDLDGECVGGWLAGEQTVGLLHGWMGRCLGGRVGTWVGRLIDGRAIE